MLKTLAETLPVRSTGGLSGADWLAILRIGLGLWWLQSFRHKDKKAWFQRGSGIAWAKSVAEAHKWAFVKTSFAKTVEPHAKAMAYVVVFSELAVGLGVAAGFLTPIALAGGLLLNAMYFVLMIKDWAEQGQNLMMALISVVCIFGQANQTWSLDHLLHILGA
jgi:thiosulfate dehydrogenase [quinone] large subunit